ncbi:hypothetical protein FHG85_07990 [Tenuifilum thalassicum]|uniref:Phosphotyrosine protein phosphatase I domain-containing protein n=2 Tax=Tenuifilum thalassicum TaxID=2590900 RepID=A0A7D4BDY1_9BACT|nr:hypothetical protein FHG85_07990 [Tenuifilum thalassicum]
MRMKKILIVSEGNACRSAMAEGWFSYYSRGSATVKSAGINPKALDMRAAQSMMDAVIDITKHKPKSIDEFKNEEFDIVLVMDKKLTTDIRTTIKHKNLYTYHFNPPLVSDDEKTTLKAYDALRDDIENWAFDFIHEHIKKLF